MPKVVSVIECQCMVTGLRGALESLVIGYANDSESSGYDSSSSIDDNKKNRDYNISSSVKKMMELCVDAGKA